MTFKTLMENYVCISITKTILQTQTSFEYKALKIFCNDSTPIFENHALKSEQCIH